MPCPECKGNVRIKVPKGVPKQPDVEAAKRKAQEALMSHIQAPVSKTLPGQWAYGVTTVPERRQSGSLLRTLASLRAGGFDRPRLFIDGDPSGFSELGLEMSFHQPRIRAVGNWVLALVELLTRNPRAGRFVIFQDDLICSKNLRAYLEAMPWPAKSYLNLFTFRGNERAIHGKGPGWHRGCELNPGKGEHWQKGLGALALCFTRDGANTLLASPHVGRKLSDEAGGWQRIDGMAVTAMNLAGWQEVAHSPSLVQHTGLDSAIGRDDPRHHNQPPAQTFLGEDFDCLSLLIPSVSAKK